MSHLTFLQLDPTAAIAPSADLVVWSRMGGAYRPEQLTHALEQERSLYEVRAYIRPTADLPLYLEAMAAWPYAKDDKRYSPPPDRWPSSGSSRTTPSAGTCFAGFEFRAADVARRTGHERRSVAVERVDRQSQRHPDLEFLNSRGEVAISGRVGRQRLWDLAARVYPRGEAGSARDGAPDPGRAPDALARHLPPGGDRHRRGAVPRGGQRRAGGGRGSVGESVVDPAALGHDFEGRTALLSPFDRLVHDRVRAEELFGFEYFLEMYKPADKRRWGYFALPILHHDRLVGKLDASADRKASKLRVHAIHEEVRYTRVLTKAVRAEIDDLAAWLRPRTSCTKAASPAGPRLPSQMWGGIVSRGWDAYWSDDVIPAGTRGRRRCSDTTGPRERESFGAFSSKSLVPGPSVSGYTKRCSSSTSPSASSARTSVALPLT